MIFRARDIVFELNRPCIMGILNVTPDSFSDGGKHNNVDAAVLYAHKMIRDGADIIDIGGQSTRPEHDVVTWEEEAQRVIPIVEKISTLGIPISVDTFYPDVAEAALKAGAHIINDVSGKVNKEMLAVVKNYRAGYIVMHNDPCSVDVAKKLTELANAAIKEGIAKECICIDPGFGFQKDTTEENIALLRKIPDLKKLGYPLLVGASRKRFIGDICNEPCAADRDAGTAAVTALAVRDGADIIRVHDIKSNLQAMRIAARFREEANNG